MIVTILRTLIMYLFVVGALRIMGKRQIGELEASELVVTIIISDIAAMPITDTEVPLIVNVIAIFTLMFLEVLSSYTAFKCPKIRRVVYGKPSTLYKDGKLDQKEMERQRFNLADIMEEIRGNGATSLSEVDYIVMETNGNVSVIMKSENSPITPKQLGVNTDNIRMNYIIIDDGTLIKGCMEKLGLNQKWLDNQLKQNGIKSVKDVFYLSFEEKSGKTIVIPKEQRK